MISRENYRFVFSAPLIHLFKQIFQFSFQLFVYSLLFFFFFCISALICVISMFSSIGYAASLFFVYLFATASFLFYFDTNFSLILYPSQVLKCKFSVTLSVLCSNVWLLGNPVVSCYSEWITFELKNGDNWGWQDEHN